MSIRGVRYFDQVRHALGKRGAYDRAKDPDPDPTPGRLETAAGLVATAWS